MGDGIALVGMGVMRYFRLAFDFKGRLLYAWSGDAYTALLRAGIDIEDGSAGPTIDRVIDGSPAARAGLRRGDVIIAVDGRRVVDAPAARRAVARHATSAVRVLARRDGRARALALQLNEPHEQSAPLDATPGGAKPAQRPPRSSVRAVTRAPDRKADERPR